MNKFQIRIKPSGMTRLQLYCNTWTIEALDSEDLWKKLCQRDIKIDDIELINLYRETHGNRVVCDAIRMLTAETGLKTFQFKSILEISFSAKYTDCGLIEFNICDGANVLWTKYDFGEALRLYEEHKPIVEETMFSVIVP